MEVKYFGCFFTYEDIWKLANQIGSKRLAETIKEPHVTLAYKPTEDYSDLYGKVIEVHVTGYANNGQNEAFGVRVVTTDERIKELLAQKESPHITISIAENAEAVNSGDLHYHRCPERILYGVLGVMDMDRNVWLSSDGPIAY